MIPGDHEGRVDNKARGELMAKHYSKAEIMAREKREREAVGAKNPSSGDPTGGGGAPGANPDPPGSGGDGAPAGSGGGLPGSGLLNGDTASGSKVTGRDLSKNGDLKKEAAKKSKVEINGEKLKAAIPGFAKMMIKAAKNVFRVLDFFPRIPFSVTFEEVTPEEAAGFTEMAAPGIDASMPEVIKKYPILMVVVAFGLLILGKLNITLKKKVVPNGPPENGAGHGQA